MAAGGFREFVAGETLDEEKINDFLMQGMLVFAGTAARGSAITAPVEGQFSFLSDSDSVEFYDGSDWVEFSSGPPQFEYLVIAGGGGGGSRSAGGAGGYRNSFASETSGGSASTETPLFLEAGISYTVTVGGGGGDKAFGNVSQFANIVSVGGGQGLITGSDNSDFGHNGGSGSSGFVTSTGSGTNQGGKGIPGQGFNGGTSLRSGVSPSGGGGGGAGALGVNAALNIGGDGGAGLASSITGSSVTRGGGGGGAGFTSGVAGAGGAGGGGAGAQSGTGGNGTVNTGGGGGGVNGTTGGNGGSGIVILRYADSITLTIGAGLTSTTASAGGFKVTQFTAGSDTVSF